MHQRLPKQWILAIGLTGLIAMVSGCGNDKGQNPDPDPPVAQFHASVASGTAPLTVSFVNTSTGAYTASAWEFGDGSTASSNSPSHTYTSPGHYTVSLTVSGTEGSNTKTISDCVTVTEAASPPAADFAVSNATGYAPLTVSFTNLTTGTFSASTWNFGDGQSSSSENPTHTYTTPGTYSVTLTVSGGQGSSTKTKSQCVTVRQSVEDVTISGSSVGGLCPVWNGGDRDFGGHGPDVRVFARLAPVNYGVATPEVRLIVDFYARETVSDFTSAAGHWEWTLYRLPAGWVFDSFIDDASTDFTYRDSDHDFDTYTFSSPEFMSYLRAKGDTEGPDVGNCTVDDCQLEKLTYRTVRVRIRKS